MNAPSVRSSPRLKLWCACLTCSLALLWMNPGCSRPGNVSEGVQLLASDEVLRPTSTFEVRFDQEVVSPDQIGQPAAESPLRIRPNVPGQFVWLASRSGVFTPSEPWRMGTVYRFALRDGLAEAGGRPLKARLDRSWRTPGLEVLDYQPRDLDPTNLPANLALRLDFNANVSLDGLANRLRFQSAAGQEIRVKVRHPQRSEYSGYYGGYYWSGSEPPPPWPQSPEEMRQLQATRPETDPVLSNCVIVTPATTLPPAKGWELRIRHGWRSAGGQASLAEDYAAPLGEVRAFEVVATTPHNALGSGTRLVIAFTKALAPSLDSTNVWEWLAINPTVDGVSALVSGSEVELRGNFLLTNAYELTIKRSLPAADGLELARPHVAVCQFAPIPPRLYLPAIEADQMAGGQRRFELMGVNVPRARLRVKLLERQTLVHALRGFKGYRKGYTGRWDANEPFREVDYNVVAGRTVYNAEHVFPNTPDQAAQLPLGWDQLLPERRHGPVLFQAEAAGFDAEDLPGIGVEALVQLTDIGLAWKESPQGSLLFAFSYRTGLPLVGLHLALVTEENEELGQAETDAMGLARFPVAAGPSYWVAERGGDLRAAAVSEHQLHLYYPNVPWDWERDRTNRLQACLFSDRPVYRPGETAHLKAIIRDLRGGQWVLPELSRAFLRLRDPQGELLLQTNLSVSPRGSTDYSWTLPSTPTGDYAAELELGENHFNHEVMVRSYRPNAFEVTLAAAPEYQAGETPTARTTARYYLGQPLTKAKATWTAELLDYPFAPEGFDRFTFGSAAGRFGSEMAVTPTHLTGEFAVEGTNTPTITAAFAPDTRYPQSRRLAWSVEVTDLNQQTVVAQAESIHHSSAFYLGVAVPQEPLRAGDRLPLRCVAVDVAGQPWPERVTIRGVLKQVEWQTVRVEGAGGAVGYRNEPVVKEVAALGSTTVPATKQGILWECEDAPGVESASFELPEAGQYVLEVRGQDPAGRPVMTATSLYVSGSSKLAWDFRNASRVELIADRASYAPGETAHLLLKAPFSGAALVSVEREAVLRSFVTNLTGNAPLVEVPIDAGDAPNVFVGVMLLRGAAESPRQSPVPEFRVGYCPLRVDRLDTRLRVAVQVASPSYRPREMVQATVDVQGTNERGLANAEVTLFAVDEGILSLTGYEMPNPWGHFNQPRPLSVGTHLTLTQLMPEDPETLTFHNKGYLVGGGGRQAARKHFLPCAFWSAALLTDERGRVTASFPAPDSLTRYRLEAVVHAGADGFGSGQAAFEINKPIMLEPVVPPVVRVGDQLVARALVVNHGTNSCRAEVQVEMDELVGGWETGRPAASRAVELAAGETSAVDIPVSFTRAGTSRWLWQVKTVGGVPQAIPAEDAVETNLEIRPPLPPVREVLAGRLQQGETNLLSGISPQTLAGDGRARLELSASRLVEFQGAAEYLWHYPYGCVEQTASTLLPWIAFKGLPITLGPSGPTNADEIIRQGITRLFSMQTWPGGLSYWPGQPDPLPWGSAYAGVILALAQERGISLPTGPRDRLCKYLEERLASPASLREEELAERCLAYCALSLFGRPPTAGGEALFGQRNRLDPTSRACLALGLSLAKREDRAIELLNPKLSTLPAVGHFASPAADLGTQLVAWLHARPQDPEVDRLLTTLLASRRAGHWGTTQGNAWALWAISEYAAKVEPQEALVQGTWHWGTNSGDLSLNRQSSPILVERSWRRGEAVPPLLLASNGRGPVCYRLSIESDPPSAKAIRQDQGFALKREYQALDDNNLPSPLRQLQPGDRVLVTLTVDNPRPAYYVVLDDPLPALLEAVHPEFRTQGTSGAAPGLTWPGSHHELRQDRALFFSDVLPPGRFVLRYLARVRAAGTVTAPPARIEEMYRPERFGTTESLQFSAGTGGL